MAGRGPAPKGRRARDRDNHEIRAVEADGELRGPELPEMDEGWHPRTLAWWETWRRSAQAQDFTPTDWDFLIDTALMHSVMWSKGRWEFASEVRLRAAKLGATPEDRLRLKMSVQTPGDSAPRPASQGGAVTDIASRRSRLSG